MNTMATATHVSADSGAVGTRTRDRVLGLSGIGFTALLLAGVLVPHASLELDPTVIPDDPSVITSFFEKHYALQQYQALMHSLAAVALLVFFAALAEQVRRSDPNAHLSARLTFVAGAGMTTIMLMAMALVAGSISQTGGVDGTTQAWIYNLGWWEHFKSLYLLPVALVPACLVLRRTRVLPAALAWSGLVLGVLAPVAMAAGLDASTEFLMFPVHLLLMVWVLATGIVALSRGLARRPTEAGE